MADRTFEIKEGVTVTDEVVGIVAGLAATEVEGVESLGAGLTNEVMAKAGSNKLSKGIKVIMGEDDKLTIRLAVNIKYGYEIPAVCRQIQEKVKNSIENMTGIVVKEVDIKIISVAVH